MSEILYKLNEGINELFPEAMDLEISVDTQLGEIPDWDSMASVNLQSFIEQGFSITVPQDLLGDDTTIGELMAFIEDPEQVEASV